MVAQLVEQDPVKVPVVGSSPAHGANLGGGMKIEATIKITLPRFVIRIWRELKFGGVTYQRAEHVDLEVLAHKNQDRDICELAEVLLGVPGVLRVEIRDWNECGVRVTL